ncbi:MAG: hypothetical protein NTX64_13955 [Elusimicrobia bacterium]|nr:hypothetical protein [Elusimicrobiota bacterium]
MKRAIFLTAALFCGCITMGTPFDVGKVPGIQVGKTTEKELRLAFGEPYRTGVEDGDDTETWLDYKYSLLGEQKTRDLYVKFNADGTVKSYSFNSSLPEDQARLKK